MGLQLRIRELYALDETNTFGSEFGSDDMYLGAVALERRGTAKHTVQLLPFKTLGEIGEFDDGDRKTYTPPKPLFNFGFGQQVFPKDIAITYVLVEKDGGETMEPFLNELHQAVKTRADKLLSDGKQDALGALGVGSAIPWEVVWKAVMRAAKYIYREWKSDEIFPPQVATISIASATHKWNGKPTSPELQVNFQAHGGHYVLKYDWHLHFS